MRANAKGHQPFSVDGLSGEFGLEFRDIETGEVEGRLLQRVDLTSGRYALLARSRDPAESVSRNSVSSVESSAHRATSTVAAPRVDTSRLGSPSDR